VAGGPAQRLRGPHGRTGQRAVGLAVADAGDGRRGPRPAGSPPQQRPGEGDLLDGADGSAVLETNPDAIALIGFGTDGAQVVTELIDQGAGPGTMPIYTGDGLQSSSFWEGVNSSDPSVVQGIRGTAPAAAPSGVEHPFAAAYAETGEDTIFSAYYYDCAIATALAAEAAQSTAADDIAAALADVTSGGTECQTFAECKELLEQGEDIDYQGASGDLTLNSAGHVVSGAYDVWEYDAEGAPVTLDVPQIIIGRD